jgi:hypothetical protein
LAAIDEGVVEVTSEGDLTLGGTTPDGIFETKGFKSETPRRMGIRPESFLEVAAVGMLAVRYNWPLERLRFQSPGWAFDLLAYADDEWSEVTIAGEAKLKQRDADALSASLKICSERGDHEIGDCDQTRNHHKKYEGLLKFRPDILWIVGPEAFAGVDPDLVFRVQVGKGGVSRLRRVEASKLRYEALTARTASPGVRAAAGSNKARRFTMKRRSSQVGTET